MLHPVPRQLPLSHEATAIAVSADGKRLAASALENSRTVLYDLRVGRVLFRFGASATAIAFSPDGTRLVTATDDRRIPSSRSGAEALRLGRASVPPPSSPISTTSLRSSEERGRSVRVWDLVTGRCLTPEPWLGDAPIAISPDGALLAVATEREAGGVLVMRLEDGALVRSLVMPEGRAPRSLLFSPDGKWLLGFTGVSPAVCWSTNDFRPGLPEGVREDDVSVGFSRAGLLALAGADCRVRIAGLDGGRTVLEVRKGMEILRGIHSLEFSSDGTIVVARGRTGATQVFSVSLARPLWTASPGPLAFLPTGNTIAAWWCGAVWLRDGENGDLIVTPPEEIAAPEVSDTTATGPSSRTVTLRSRELEGRLGQTHALGAPVITEAATDGRIAARKAAALSLLARLSMGWAESGYRQSALVAGRDPDGLGVRLPLRGGFAYVQMRPLSHATSIVVNVTADDPDLEPPPSSSLARFSRWIRDRLAPEARRQAQADREWVAELGADAREGEFKVERGQGTITITLERATLPSLEDIEALVHAAEQKLAL